MKESRREQILAMVRSRERVTMQALCSTFGVSMNTIRSDVAFLVAQGAVEKIYGGIRYVEQKEIPLFDTRAVRGLEAKTAIAQAAQAYIADGDVLYLDAGTTAMRLLEFLDPGKQITVVTSSLAAVSAAYSLSNVNLMALPGACNRRTCSLLDGSTVEYVNRFQFTKAFLGASSLSREGDLGVTNYLERELKQAALARSQQSYLLFDSSKFGRAALMSYGNVRQLDLLISDRQLPAPFVESCRSAGTAVLLA